MLDHGAQHGLVGRQAGHADALALEVARARTPGAGDDRGERALHEGADADQVLAPLAREAEVVDVEHADVGAAGGEQLQRVGAAAGGRADPQPDAVVGVRPVRAAA